MSQLLFEVYEYIITFNMYKTLRGRHSFAQQIFTGHLLRARQCFRYLECINKQNKVPCPDEAYSNKRKTINN